MTTPTYQQWAANSIATNGLQAQTVRERTLAALASFVSGQNPDGTPRGS